MKEWLYEILKNNTLVDNQTYSVKEGIFTNQNRNRSAKPITLEHRKKGETNRAHNDENAIWNFLNATDKHLRETLLNVKDKSIVLFNNRDYEHNSDDNLIEVTGVDSRNFTLKTGNLIGYVKKGNYALKISSRFGDKFLKYIISDADGFIEIDNYGGKNEKEGFEWLLIYLWKTKMKKAYRLGLPKSYITQEDKLTKVRGNIDVLDYFSNKNLGKYKCTFREHSYDNDATRLISATFKKIGNHEFLNGCHLIRNGFYTATNGEHTPYRQLNNTKHFSNPFYKNYNEVIDLSKLILKKELSGFGDRSKDNAFLFDISMLFEYFIMKLIRRMGLSVESKFNEPMKIPTGIESFSRKLEPDIVFHHENNTFLFDVKYKSFDFRYGVSREDLFQLHTYVAQYGNIHNLKACGFIFPIASADWSEITKTNKHQFKSTMKIMGTELSFYVLFIKIPNETEEDYNAKFKDNCAAFLKYIMQVID